MFIFLNIIDDQEDLDKLQAIYELYKKRMLYTAGRILGEHFESEDAVHNAFIAIARNIHKLGDADSTETASYVLKAVKNTALNQLRSKKRRDSMLLIEDCIFVESEDAIWESLCNEENCENIKRCILSLEERYCDVLSLRYLNELSIREIAVRLDRKPSTVKQQIRRGKKLLITALLKVMDGFEAE